MKNNPSEDSPFFARVNHTHGLLRVMESVRSAEGDEPIGNLYTTFGENIHHQRNAFVTAEELLTASGLDLRHASAYADESWDATIRAQMDEGLALTGNDVGTPIMGFRNDTGKTVGFFGPVISRRLSLDDGLKLWDGLQLMAGIDSFWELKRTRTEDPDFTVVT
jgi:hypothetical protein